MGWGGGIGVGEIRARSAYPKAPPPSRSRVVFVLTGVMGSGARKEVAIWAGKSEIGSRAPKRTPPDPPRGLIRYDDPDLRS